MLQASAGGGNVTQVAFYASSKLIGTVDSPPYNFYWRSAPVGAFTLTAVALTDDPDNTGLASEGIAFTNYWPTNVGQVAFSATDLEIPTAGIPLTISRRYDTRFRTNGLLGFNWKGNYDDINIEVPSLSSGWQGAGTGPYGMSESSPHLLVVSLSDSEKYYFTPLIIFRTSQTNTINNGTKPDVYNEEPVDLVFFPVSGQNAALTLPRLPNTIGMDEGLGRPWARPLTLASIDEFLTITPYEPALTDYTFTAPDGKKYKFDANGKFTSLTDRNGNQVNYVVNDPTSADLTWSNPSSGGSLSVHFDLDENNGWVNNVYDPIAVASNGVPTIIYRHDAIGNLTNVARLIDRAGGGTYENTYYTYTNTVFSNFVTSIKDPRGVIVQRNVFDSAGRLYQQFDALNNPVTYTYDVPNRRQVTTDRLGYSTVQYFTPSGLLGAVQHPYDGMEIYTYNDRGLLIAETNALKQGTTYAYDENDNLISSTNALQQGVTASNNEFGQPLLSTDALGNGTISAYSDTGNLVAVTNGLGIVSLYGYNDRGNRTAETNAAGLPEQAVTRYGYNELGFLTNLVDALNNSVAYVCDLNGNRLSETRTRTGPSGTITLVTSNLYDARNRVTMTVGPDGATNRVAFNGAGLQSSTVDKMGRTNFFFYDARALLTNTTFPDATYETIAYDAEGRKTNSTDRSHNPTSFYYDPSGRLYYTLYADGIGSANIYDLAGRVVTTVLYPVMPSGPGLPTTTPQYTYYGFDATGRRIAVTNALFQATRMGLDANNNQTNLIDALNRSTTNVFDALNRQIRIKYPDGTSEGFAYDGLGRRVGATNQAGIVTRFGFDALDRLVAVTNAHGTTQQTVTRYAYDEVGNQTAQIDALLRTNRFEYDNLGRKVRTILPGGQSEGRAYDRNGNLTFLTNFTGLVVTFTNDVMNRLLSKSVSNVVQVTYAYSPTGQRTNMVDASGTYSYTYDTRDRLLTKNTPQGNLTYTYNAFGNLSQIASSTPNGTLVNYYYDQLNRLTNVVDRFNNSTCYGFDSVGNLQTVRYPNTATNTYSYNSLNRLTNLIAKTGSGTLASFAYQLGAAGNRTSLSDLVNGFSRSYSWQYDPLYRLTNETLTGTAPTGAASYRYDAVGNRTNRTSTLTGITNQTLAYGTNDWLATDVYDNNGNTRTNGGNVYQYDFENRLTNFNNGTAIYVYDGNGNRVSVTTNGVKVLYLVDDRNPSGYAQVIEELTVSGGTTNLAKSYTYGLDLISQRQVASGTTSFYGYDGNGNTRYLAGTNGIISDTYVFDAFGTLLTSSGTTANIYLYSGEQYDPNLGFYYLRARYLNPGMGRFWTRDSASGSNQDPSSLHKYLYVHNNPIIGIDPTGHEFSISGLYYSMGAYMYLFAQSHATIINVSRIALTSLTLSLVVADNAGLLTADKSILGIYISSGGNPLAEMQYVVGEIRTLRTALVAARTLGNIGTLSRTEMAIANEAKQILASSELAQIRTAQKAGNVSRFIINGRTIQYQPKLPFSAITWFEERGFVLGEEAFASEEEMTKTILHELYRLSSSQVTSGGAVSQSLVQKETVDAYQFAERAYKEIFK